MTCPIIDETNLPVDFSAKWIAPPGEKGSNYTFLARKEFLVPESPVRAILRIAADSRYVLYLNGQRVGQGPARGTDNRYFFDSYDVTAALRKGKNHLAARVHSPVTPLSSTVLSITPAILAEIEDLVKTDTSWEVCIDPSARSDAPFYTHHIGYSEYRDFRKEPVGWERGEDNADIWSPAEEIADANELGRVLSPRTIPALSDDRYRPELIVGTGGVPLAKPGIEDDVEYAALMQGETHFKPDQPRFFDTEALTWGGSAKVLPWCFLSNKATMQGAYIILDFGREICGNVMLDIEAPEGTILDIGYDEDVRDGRLDTLRVNVGGPLYRFADRYILRGGRQRIENHMHDRGFRLIQLTLRRFEEPVRIHSIEAANRVYPIPVEASFECDQLMLNRLWDACVQTLQECSMDLFVDCPWREQTLWLDDHLQENLFYFTLTSDRVFPAHNLRVSAEGALANGMIPSRYPSQRTCLLPVTSANWITVLSDYYLYTGDLELVKELLPVIDKALSVYQGWTEEDGLVADRHDPGMWNFIDWGYDISGVQLDGKVAALNMLIAGAYKLAAGLHEAAGNSERAEEYRGRVGEITAAIKKCFWLEEEQHFYDCTAPLNNKRSFSQVPHGVGLYYELLDDKLREGALNVLLDPGAIRAEFGYQLFVIDALVRNGRAQEGLKIIHDLWPHMIQPGGSPTLWEVVDGRDAFGGCGSLCHAFSCLPMFFMQTALLGVRPLKPGFEEFSLVPQSLGVLRAKGHIPTPHGAIYVAWSLQDDGSLDVDVSIPDQTTAVLADGRRLEAGRDQIIIPPAPQKR